MNKTFSDTIKEIEALEKKLLRDLFLNIPSLSSFCLEVYGRRTSNGDRHILEHVNTFRAPANFQDDLSVSLKLLKRGMLSEEYKAWLVEINLTHEELLLLCEVALYLKDSEWFINSQNRHTERAAVLEGGVCQ